MNPKIFFKYAGIYDTSLYHFVSGEMKSFEDEYFTKRKEFVKEVMKKIDKWWNDKGENILENISRLSELKWKQNGIKVYLLPDPHRPVKISGFSEPVTIFLRTYKKGKLKKRSFIEIRRIIIHELVHQNVMLKEEYEDYIKEIKNKYGCNRVCAAHLIVHAILEKVFTIKELKDEMKMNHSPDYEQAWKIVNQEGSDKIITSFVNYI